MMPTSLYAMLTLSKTTSPQKLIDYDCITHRCCTIHPLRKMKKKTFHLFSNILSPSLDKSLFAYYLKSIRVFNGIEKYYYTVNTCITHGLNGIFFFQFTQFCGDVVLDSFNKTSRDEDNILDQIH